MYVGPRMTCLLFATKPFRVHRLPKIIINFLSMTKTSIFDDADVIFERLIDNFLLRVRRCKFIKFAVVKYTLQ